VPAGKVRELKYLIEIPIPYVDKKGRKLDSRRRKHWRRRLELLLTDCFGGFTPSRAPALNRVRTETGRWVTLSERGQVVLRSACADRKAFLHHRDRLVEFVVSMGEALNQAEVFVLAYPSDALLIEVTERIC
jgi:hypothetical protein